MPSLETALNIRKHDSGMQSVFSRLGTKLLCWHPFGCEYSLSSKWKPLERYYIRFFGLVDLPTRMRARLITKALAGIPWKTMLDFGSGTGAYSFYFSRSQDVRVWGMDISRGRVEDSAALRQKLGRNSLDFVVSSRIFETNRFQPDSIDVVLAIEVMQYLFDIHKGFQEIQQVLSPGGYLIGHFPLQGYGQKPETIRFDLESLERFIAESGMDLISATRVFGGTARFLSRIYASGVRSRLCTAFVFPLLLLASFACGGKNSTGSYCLVVARKPKHKNGSVDPSLQEANFPLNPKPIL